MHIGQPLKIGSRYGPGMSVVRVCCCWQYPVSMTTAAVAVVIYMVGMLLGVLGHDTPRAGLVIRALSMAHPRRPDRVDTRRPSGYRASAAHTAAYRREVRLVQDLPAAAFLPYSCLVHGSTRNS